MHQREYDTAIDAESAYEILRDRVAAAAAPAGSAGSAANSGFLGHLGAIAGTIFGTNAPRGRLSTGQLVARNVMRSVTNRVIGGVVADLGKQVGRIDRRLGRPRAGARRARRSAPPITRRFVLFPFALFRSVLFRAFSSVVDAGSRK